MGEGRATEIETFPVRIVLVHGAYHGSWCWEKVRARLRASGRSVTALDLPMNSVSGDAHVVREAIADASSDGCRVLVVAHSYAGLVASSGGHGADHLMFVAAPLPRQGQSARDFLPGANDGTAGLAALDGNPPARAMDVFYSDCDRDEALAASKRLVPRGLATISERIDRVPAWATVASSYVVCANDRSLDPIRQAEWAEQLGSYVVLDSDHSPFLSCVEPIVARIEAVADALANDPEPGDHPLRSGAVT